MCQMDRSRRGAVLAALAPLLPAIFVGVSHAQPELLSPARTEEPTVIEETCPTFSWSEVGAATGYELEIFPAADPAPLRIELPAGALTWTPPGATCARIGGRARWRVRTAGPGVLAAWSDTAEFLVRPASSSLSAVHELLNRLASARLTEDQHSQLKELGWHGRLATATTSESLAEPTTIATPSDPSRMVSTPSSAGFWIAQQDDIAVSARGIGVSVWGQATSIHGTGVRGEIDHGEVTVETVAIEGTSSEGLGVLGQATSESTNNIDAPNGLLGESPSGIGLHGWAVAATGSTRGIYGESYRAGICAFATGSTTPVGAYGAASSSAGFDFYAGGAGANYGTFTGGHEVRLLPTEAEPQPGWVVSVTGRVEVRRNARGAVDLSSTLPTVRLADSERDTAVFGVVTSKIELPEGHWFEDQSGDFAAVNALGEGRVWVTDRKGQIVAGDYLTTSPVPGHAQRQDDRQLHSYTLGKAIETIDWQEVATTIEHDGETYRAALIAVIYTSG